MIYPLNNSCGLFELKEMIEQKIEGRLSTYKIIRFCLENFEKEIYSLNLLSHETLDYNSCVQTALAIHKIILNRDENTFFENCLLDPVAVELEKFRSFRFLDLFTGSAMTQVLPSNPLPIYFESLKKQAASICENMLCLPQPSLQNHEDTLNAIWRIDFNLDTFHRFKNELLSTSPIEKDGQFFTACARYSQNLENRHIYHILSIEKYRNTANEDRYRIYESMVAEYSLLESFIYRGYRQGEKDEGCLNLKHMMLYLDDLEKVFCSSSHTSQCIPPHHFQKCVSRDMPPFQNPITSPPYLTIDEESKVIGGVNFLYFKWNISHQDTLNNLAELISQNSLLLKKFSMLCKDL